MAFGRGGRQSDPHRLFAEPGPADDVTLRRHSSGLEELVQTYALVINELTLENQQLKAQLDGPRGNVVPLSRARRP